MCNCAVVPRLKIHTRRSHWDAPHPGSAVEKYIVDEAANEMLIDTQIAFKDGENINFK